MSTGSVSFRPMFSVRLISGGAEPTKRLRARIARLSRTRAPDLKHLANLVGIAAEGPDSEASLVYARMLRDECNALLTAAAK